MMKLALKSLFTSVFLVSLLVIVTGCSNNVDIEDNSFEFKTPDINAGDIYKQHDSEGDVYLCFNSANSGTGIINQYKDKDNNICNYEITSYAFKYKGGDAYINDEYWISLVVRGDYVKYFIKNNCYKRMGGNSGLFSKFILNNEVITLYKSGKVKVENDKGLVEAKFKNNNGLITIYDKSASFNFYYLEEGYLVSDQALFGLSKVDEVELHLIMDDSDYGKQIPDFIKSLPDSLFYKLNNLKYGKVANLNTVRQILEANPQKKFLLYRVDYASDECTLNNLENLYEINSASYGTVTKVNKSLKKEMFMGCKNLQKISDSEFIALFGSSCFEGCTALSDVIISGKYYKNGKTEYKNVIISPNAFKECSNLKVKLDRPIKHVYVKVSNTTLDIYETEIKDKMENLAELLTGKYVACSWEID